MLNVLPYACSVIVYVIVGFNLKYVERPPTEFNDWNYVCVQENKLLMQVKGYPHSRALGNTCATFINGCCQRW